MSTHANRTTPPGWSTWTETRAKLNVDEAAVAEARAELEAEIAAYRLAEIRKEQGKPQTAVAKAMGVTQKRVSEIESAELERTELSTISRYVAALGGKVHVVAEFPGRDIVTIR
ncbi:helix-turn-helix domain-containing protein [Jiangella muralis]|uniref:helix-turn-helix domain-containing protein n=1 Tax=Jiangella muralis TaxID=702383 RepID=UPI0009FADDC0|nr:XRE family transcriptional regulator [Jiangella muralis]